MSVYLDDILVTGATEQEHLENLDTVLSRLETAGMRLKRNKCAFLLSAVEYLGHKISAKGLQPTDDKIQAIRRAPAPADVSQLKSFLGLVNYYCKFLPNLSNTLAPLYRLLQKKVKWNWGPEQQKAFQAAKGSLTSDSLLVHFDPAKKLILAADASPYGLGAVLSHRLSDGTDKPIAFASRTLAAAEKKYSQIEKEGLAIIFGVKRFHQYLFGRPFIIMSDHKPLKHLFSESQTTPTLASARLQRWSLTLGAYDYIIEYKPGHQHSNADMLSRLLVLDMLNSLPVTAEHIKQWTNRDTVLSRVRTMIQRGWQDSNETDLMPYQRRKNELSVHDGCVLWGCRVIVPPAGREKITQELHEGHPGVTRMKALARSFVWWPQLDKDIEELVKNCDDCQQSRHLPPVAPLQPWEWPQRPRVRVHADYAGPFMNKYFLILVDSHSKWIEVKPVNNATSTVTIDQLRSIFATHGIPEMLVTDNGSVFTSEEFEKFTKQNGIRHVKSAPYHPASNGLVERAVQTFKEFMKKMKSGSIEANVSRFLLQYRITPHSTTGISPSEMLMGRRPRSCLDLIIPDISKRVIGKQQIQKANHDHRGKQRTLNVGDSVNVRNFAATGDNWLPGSIVESLGPLSFCVKLSDGRLVKRHIGHILVRPDNHSQQIQSDAYDWLDPPHISQTNSTEQSIQPTELPEQSLPRRSSRVSVPPQCYGQTKTSQT